MADQGGEVSATEKTGQTKQKNQDLKGDSLLFV